MGAYQLSLWSFLSLCFSPEDIDSMQIMSQYEKYPSKRQHSDASANLSYALWFHCFHGCEGMCTSAALTARIFLHKV